MIVLHALMANSLREVKFCPAQLKLVLRGNMHQKHPALLMQLKGVLIV